MWISAVRWSRSEVDVSDIDRDEERFGQLLVVDAARIDPPTVGGHHDPPDLAIVVNIVGAAGAAENAENLAFG
jgi:hypothetical protein